MLCCYLLHLTYSSITATSSTITLSLCLVAADSDGWLFADGGGSVGLTAAPHMN